MMTDRLSAPAPSFRLSRALVSGFIATIAMLCALLVSFALITLLTSRPPATAASASTTAFYEALHALTHNAVVDLTRNNLYAAIGLHLAIGLVWAVVYAYFAEARLPGTAWQRGVLFSLLPWVLSVTVFLPLVGGGFFGLAMGADALPVIGNLLLHLIYGAVLGLVYGPFGDIVFDEDGASEAELRAMAGADRSAAIGLLGGGIVGLIAGGVGAAILQSQPQATFGGLSPLALFVGTTLLAGSFGGLIGSFAAGPAPAREPAAEPAPAREPGA
jgi:hypothetical protein